MTLILIIFLLIIITIALILILNSDNPSIKDEQVSESEKEPPTDEYSTENDTEENSEEKTSENENFSFEKSDGEFELEPRVYYAPFMDEEDYFLGQNVAVVGEFSSPFFEDKIIDFLEEHDILVHHSASFETEILIIGDNISKGEKSDILDVINDNIDIIDEKTMSKIMKHHKKNDNLPPWLDNDDDDCDIV